MLKKWLAVTALLALCSLLFVGRASAQTYTFERLRALLVTQADISDTGLQFLSDDQQSLSGGLLQVIREFGTNVPGGAKIGVVSLIGAQDGSSPPTSATNLVVGGDLLKIVANAVGAQIENFTLSGSQGVGDLDQSAVFTAIFQGTEYQFYGDSFVSGNLIAIVVYGAPTDQASADDAQTLLYAQDNKLP